MMIDEIRLALTAPKRVYKRICYRTLKKIGHCDYNRFIVLARSRTGSNMLLSFLNSHPNIEAHGEIVNRLHGNDYREILKKTFSKKPRYIKAVGFKIFYYHPMDDKSCRIWNDLSEMKDLRVIHLKRRNMLKTLVSAKIAGMQDVWKNSKARMSHGAQEKAVTFTVEELEKGFKKFRALEENGEHMFSKHQCVNVYYENLVENPEFEFKRITDLLQVTGIKPNTDLRKQNPERLSDLITNYEVLKIAFAGSEWESYFEV